jgi:hypothetical protein
MQENPSLPRRRAQEPSPEVRVCDLRVIKTIARARDGAKRQTLVHGDRLVCVRHRIDPRTQSRYVTVELVSEVLPIRSLDNREVSVRIGPADKRMRVLLLSFGAAWDSSNQVWRMPRGLARTLRLLDKIVRRPG